MSNIKFIYFDVGGVIIDWKPAHQKIHDLGGKSVEEVNDVFHRQSIPQTKNTNDLLHVFNSELNLHFPEYNDFITMYAEAFSPILQTHTLMHELYKNFAIGLLSNTEPLLLETAIKLGKIPDISYTAMLASCYEGLHKPDKAFYALAQKKAGVDHKNILFIDDLERNLIPAQSLGWQTVLFKTNNPANSCEAIKKILAAS